jgi:class 3 adenylate cyclase/predicted ATPase
MECPSCHSEIAERSKFCSECGVALPALCPSCGAANHREAKFCRECGQALRAAGAARPAAAAGSSPAPGAASAERRQLTIMFCDLVGSTALSARLDPEDVREIIGAYHRCCAGVIAQARGFVAKYMGDGVLAYFGYPQAHEHDAERAVRGALALVDAVSRLPAGPHAGLQVRIGIATGIVVVGDLIGEGAAQERGVVGDVPNLAARLQVMAEPGQVLIAPTTQLLTGGLFKYRDLGEIALRGLSEKVRAWQVLRASAFESRFEALHATGLMPLIGRERELELVLRHWHQAQAGDGGVVLLSGEPGIGKSRIVSALQERLIDGPYARLSYFCSPHDADRALHPIIAHLERAAGFTARDTAAAKLAKLEELLARATPAKHDVGYIAELLMLPAERFGLPELTPQQRKAKTLAALLGQVEGLAARHPVLIVFEDAHWADPSSLELLTLTVERCRHLPVLLLITARPEFVPSWPAGTKAMTIALTRLSRQEGSALVEKLTARKALPEEVLEQILDRTDGVPLFVEELTKSVLESGIIRETDGRYVLTGPLAPMAIPTTLHASLMARLDRLSAVREVAQIGATIGREFSRDLLRTLVPMSNAALGSALAQLVASGLVIETGAEPNATYAFKHALVHDAAYGTLLRSRRQELHSRIATGLEEQFPEFAEQHPELLAHHYTEARLIDRAVWYWGRAGRLSMARSAMTEAVRQLQKGLELLTGLPDGSLRRHQELELQCALSGALVASKGQGAPETGKAYARARELCEQLGDGAALVPVLSGLCTYHLGHREYEAARRIAGDLLHVAEERGDTASRLVGHRSMGACLHQLGQFGSAADHLEQVLALYVPKAHHGIASVAAQDMRAAALSYLSLDLLILGHPQRAFARVEEAVSWARELGHPHLLVFALTGASYFHLLRRAEPAASVVVEELVSLSREQKFPFWLALGNLMRGYLLAVRGDLADGEALSRQSFDDLRRMGSSWNETYDLGLLASCCARSGKFGEALDLLGRAVELADSTGERWFEAELRRLNGEWLIADRRGEPDAAAAHLQRAIAVAREQNAKLWELRAAASLARLRRDQGKRVEARALLAPVHGWFTEGLDTPDLKDAKALLEEL